jgi:hypothetical protein
MRYEKKIKIRSKINKCHIDCWSLLFFFIYNTVNKKKPLIKKEDWNGG